MEKKKILILSPHTDDAEIGCGGAISKFIEEGHEILWIAFSTAEESLPKGFPAGTLKKEFLEVIHSIGLKEENCHIFDFKVRKLYEKRQEVLEELRKIYEEYRPDLVIAPSINDYHQDHQVVANEAIRAFKKSSSIICYELPWNHIKFDTQFFVGLKEKNLETKWAILQKYKSQLAKHSSYFSKEFVYGLAKVRGAQCNSEYAEAFEVIRWKV